MTNLLGAFREVWASLDNPHSGSPDVSLDHVADVMATILAKQIDPDLSELERWIVAYVGIRGAYRYDLEASYATGRVNRFDANQKPRNYDDVIQEEDKIQDEVHKAIDKLLDSQTLIMRDKQLFLSHRFEPQCQKEGDIIE